LTPVWARQTGVVAKFLPPGALDRCQISEGNGRAGAGRGASFRSSPRSLPAGRTLHHFGRPIARPLYPKRGGRAPRSFEDRETLEWMGPLHRPLSCGQRAAAFPARPALDLASFGTEATRSISRTLEFRHQSGRAREPAEVAAVRLAALVAGELARQGGEIGARLDGLLVDRLGPPRSCAACPGGRSSAGTARSRM